MWKKLSKIKEGILDILFPKTCLSCGQEGRYICDNCNSFMTEAPAFLTAENFEVFSMWQCQGHQDPLLKVVRKINKDGLTDAISELIKMAFLEMFKDQERFKPLLSFVLDKETYITYVPLHWKEASEPQLMIAQAFGKLIDKKPVSLLKRTRETVPQEGLPKEQRAKNIENAFQFEFSPIPAKVLLIDDIWASGATMKECYRVLRLAGVKKVMGFTLGKIA